MNLKRTNFELPANHNIIITPYWLLGFSEGECSFSVSSSPDINLCFNLTQVITEKKVMEAIKIFLLDLPGSYKIRSIHSNPIRINVGGTPKSKN